MAYLDDHNDNLYQRGDPLEALDKELAELRATLGALDDGENVSEEPEKQPAESPEQSPAAEQQPTPREPNFHTPYEPKPVPSADKPVESGAKSRASLIIVIVLVAAAILLGAGYAVMRLILSGSDGGGTVATSSGELVTINDSVMGNIELQTVQGAEINTYDAENLVTDENGYLSYYQDGQKTSALGVDLSEYQGEVDFAAVKAAGVDYVMLRIGGRYYSDEGGLYEDSAFDTYYEQAKAAGLKVGAYFFSQAADADDAVEEARFAIAKLNGRALDYPIAFDWENIEQDEARTDHVTGSVLTAMAEAFCDTVTESGYRAIVYSNTSQMFIMYDFETMKDYDFWLADYRDFPTMYYHFDMWQYSIEGTVDGIEGYVDMNLCFNDFQ